MISNAKNHHLYKLARKLAESNAEAEPGIIKVLWFPDDNQVRLVEVLEETVPVDEEIEAFYFSKTKDFPYVSGIALIRPDEENRVQLPAGWGSWESAQVVYDRAA